MVCCKVIFNKSQIPNWHCNANASSHFSLVPSEMVIVYWSELVVHTELVPLYVFIIITSFTVGLPCTSQPTNIIFLLDSSGSVDVHWNDIRAFTSTAIMNLGQPRAASDLQFAVIQFAASANIAINFNTYRWDYDSQMVIWNNDSQYQEYRVSIC